MALEISVLELFSGMGGYHSALTELSKELPDVHFNVKAAVDVNEVTNRVYKHNFQTTQVISKAIESVPNGFLKGLNVDLLVMSPPCQPFTRLGLKRDTGDSRCRGLQHVVQCLNRKVIAPKWILLENVKGFEESEAFEEYNKCLADLGYDVTVEFLHPFNFGVPNARLRCYVLASLSSNIPPISDNQSLLSVSDCKIGPYLSETADVGDHHFLSPEAAKKYLPVMDVVSRESTHCMCFTKSYGRYYEGTGSLFFQPNICDDDIDGLKSTQLKELVLEGRGKLRLFSDSEVLKLHSFPDWFSFPDDVTRKQKYKMLGNGLNVLVVKTLIAHLLKS
ncbi:tRNA (cytosine(38)-C(5))-methyltransferase-like isoform X2 [Convolutriloba macropyga]|uniref:tRNA (cytosine(38)-C(5))-methyltransferase-like isoform X2 n=1 Tax=Convolutriloba macropyga TaxID=536237 RepID=UPI003F526B46